MPRVVLKSRFRRRKRGVQGELNLTSLTDMFAFILTFLLKTLSISTVDVKPPPGMRLPATSAMEKPQRYVAIDILNNGIYLEKKLVQPLYRFELPNVSESERRSDTLATLQVQLKTQINLGALESTTAVIRADRDTPYDLIWKVMYTAKQVGFEEFQNFAVQQASKI